MRVWGQRYSRDLQRYNLAMRMIGHEARTHTICAWTGLPDDRIRTLYQSYVVDRGERHAAVRHRGPSPQRLAYFLSSARLRSEAAALAGLCCLLEVIPQTPLSNIRRDLPTVARGERLCTAFEMYRGMIPVSRMTLEHVVLLVMALAQGSELQLGHCVSCGGMIVTDRYGTTRRSCGHCAELEPHRVREILPRVMPQTPRELPVDQQQALF